MNVSIPFDNSFAALPEGFYTRLDPTPVARPSLVAFNRPLAGLLGIDAPEDEGDLARIFSGNEVPKGAAPLAQLYAGHQFGQFNPQLGDGRAHPPGRSRRHRRASAATSSSRAPARRPIRAWATAAPGSDRSCANTSSPKRCTRSAFRRRARWPPSAPARTSCARRPLPGAVLTRVAQSHIRVGTFQIFAARRDLDALQRALRLHRRAALPGGHRPRRSAATGHRQAGRARRPMDELRLHPRRDEHRQLLAFGRDDRLRPLRLPRRLRPRHGVLVHRPVRTLRLCARRPTSSCGTWRSSPPRSCR